MKIGILWEHGVSKWTMSPFELLMDKHEVIVFIGEKNKFDHSLVELNKVKMSHAKEYLYGLKKPFKAIKRIFKNPYKKMDFYLNTLDILLDDSFDIIITHDGSRSLHTLCELKKTRRFKLVVSYAENIPFRSVYDKKTDYIKENSWDKIDILLPWCNTIKQALIQEGISEEKIKVIYQGVNTNIFFSRQKDEELIEKFRISKDKFTFSYIGKLVSWKGVQYILYAANLLKNKGINNFQILITGKGAQKSNLEEIIKKMGLEDFIIFTGFVDYVDISKLFSIADCLILPSIPILTWQEQYGMVLVESLACHKPVLVSKSGSIPEIVDNAGLYHIPGDWNELADNMIKIMNDNILYNNLVEHGKNLIKEKYSVNVHAKELEKVLNELLNK
jgi:glycosyltransferase involved in cell wall biosynthesis